MQEIKCPKCGEVFQIDESSYAAIVKQVRDAEFEKDKATAIKLAQSENDIEIERLKNEIAMLRKDKDLAIREAVSDKELEIQKLQNEIENAETKSTLNEKNLRESYEMKLQEKDTQIDYYKDLKTKMSTKMIGETLEQHCSYEFNKNRFF